MKLKRILACALSASMLVTGVSFSGDFKCGTVQAATELDDQVMHTTFAEIDSTILAKNAKAKSEMNPADKQDGPASWAFDDEDHWWHTKWQNEVNNEGKPSAGNPIWIQTGFDGAKKIKKITYQSRDNGMGSIRDYKVQYANVTGREPEDSDFRDVPGASGTFENVRTEQEVVFGEAVDATHIRLVALSEVYTNNGNNYVAAKRIRVFEEKEVKYDFNKQGDFWDYEIAHGDMADQGEAGDRWHYQIKENGVWKDLPASAYNGTTWMTNQNLSDYYWAKLAKGEITSTFSNSNAAHQALAFSWKAPKAGYYKATLERTMTNTNGSKLDFMIGHAKAGETNDGKILLEGVYGNGQTFTSKIAKAEAGDFIRIGAKKKDAWVQNFLPMVVEVTAKDYAEQYLTEVEGVENQGTYTESSKQAVKDAREQLQAAVGASESDMADIDAKIKALEQAIADLKEYVAVESVTLNKDTLPLTIGETETLTATVNPDTATEQDVTWNSLNPDVAAVDDTGLVEAKKAGNAVIEVYSTNHPDKKATCTVVVTRDDTELDAVIAEAEEKLQEENFEAKYTETSKAAFKEDLDMARAAKKDTEMSPADVKEVVDALKASMSGLELKAVVTIDNNGTTETKYCEVGERVKVVAKAAPEGMKFAYWTVDGKPICYSESYTFTVYKDTTVKAVYIEKEEEVQKSVSVLCNVSYANGKVKFLSKHSVPADAGYKVLRAGVVATDSKGYAAIEAAGEELTLETTATTRLKKYGVNTNYYLANFTQYLNSSFKTTWYAKGYVMYQDSEGQTHTVYSDVAQCTVQ